jgi:hypothetical protein
LFNSIKLNKKVSQEVMFSYIEDLEHGLFHGFCTAFLACWHKLKYVPNNNVDFMIPKEWYLALGQGANHKLKNEFPSKFIASCLLHDFGRFVEQTKRHDLLSVEYFNLLQIVSNHSVPTDINSLVIADRLELQRFKDFNQWIDFQKLDVFDKDIRFFYKYIRPALQQLFKYRRTSWIRHGIEIRHYSKHLYQKDIEVKNPCEYTKQLLENREFVKWDRFASKYSHLQHLDEEILDWEPVAAQYLAEHFANENACYPPKGHWMPTERYEDGYAVEIDRFPAYFCSHHGGTNFSPRGFLPSPVLFKHNGFMARCDSKDSESIRDHLAAVGKVPIKEWIFMVNEPLLLEDSFNYDGYSLMYSNILNSSMGLVSLKLANVFMQTINRFIDYFCLINGVDLYHDRY